MTPDRPGILFLCVVQGSLVPREGKVARFRTARHTRRVMIERLADEALGRP